VYTRAAVKIGILYISQTMYVYWAIVRVRDTGVVHIRTQWIYGLVIADSLDRGSDFFSHPSLIEHYILYHACISFVPILN